MRDAVGKIKQWMPMGSVLFSNPKASILLFFYCVKSIPVVSCHSPRSNHGVCVFPGSGEVGPMDGIIQMYFLGFLIGLTGALAPGPTLIATINASLKGGWSMGPRVTLGHIAVEILMVILIIAGLSVILGGYSWMIAGIGGVALMVFGTLTILESRHTHINHGQRTAVEDRTFTRPFVAGVVTSISNPYFWLWWFTVGSALMISAYAGGLATAASFILGHWTADLGWFTLVSASIHRGRFFLGEREYRWILTACGIFLIFFGGYYLILLVNQLGFGCCKLPIL